MEPTGLLQQAGAHCTKSSQHRMMAQDPEQGNVSGRAPLPLPHSTPKGKQFRLDTQPQGFKWALHTVPACYCIKPSNLAKPQQHHLAAAGLVMVMVMGVVVVTAAVGDFMVATEVLEFTLISTDVSHLNCGHRLVNEIVRAGQANMSPPQLNGAIRTRQ